jgi:hypothetical protein
VRKIFHGINSRVLLIPIIALMASAVSATLAGRLSGEAERVKSEVAGFLARVHAA